MTQQVQEYWPHELVAGGAVNCRPGEEDVSDLVASITAHGLLQPLVGRLLADGMVEIIDGNRRLKALQQLFHAETLTERVPVVLRGDEAEADAFEISLAANVLRKPLHPVAEYEAFAKLAAQGKALQEIADHFGLTLRNVEQRMALGRLHPDVRKRWQEGGLTGEAARAFTLGRPEEQAAYLAKANPHWGFHAQEIRRAFTKETVRADGAKARFIAAEYEAAGGAMVPDLFTEKPDLADSGLVERLVAEKLARAAKEIAEAEGWAEVLLEGTPETEQRYRWDQLRKPALPDDQQSAELQDLNRRGEALNAQLGPIDDQLEPLEEDENSDEAEIERLQAERRAVEDEIDEVEQAIEALNLDRAAWLTVPEEKRAKAVAVVGITHDGKLNIMRGYLKGKAAPKPEPATALPRPAPAPTAGGDEAPEPARLSAALLDDLALTATRAAAHVLAEHPRIAFAALVAAHVSYGAPVRLTSNGRNEGPAMGWPERSYESKTAFPEVFRTCLAMPEARLHTLIARVAARSLDFTSKAVHAYDMDRLKPEAVTDLRCALPADQHRKALVQAFDPEAYFKAAPKQEAFGAIADCGDDPGKHSKLKKGDLVALASRLAGEHGWLPAILRGEVFTATAELPRIPAPEDEAPSAEAVSDAEAHQSAAEAAQQIWSDQERARLDALKTPAIRDELKQRGVTVPFGATREAIIALAMTPAEREEEAA